MGWRPDLRKLLRCDQGQNLIEYTLLLAFVAIASCGLFLTAGGSVKQIWTTGNRTVACAAVAAGATSGSPDSTAPTPRGDDDDDHH